MVGASEGGWIWWATLIVEDLFMISAILIWIPLWRIGTALKRVAVSLEKPDEVVHIYENGPQVFSVDADDPTKVEVRRVGDWGIKAVEIKPEGTGYETI